MKKSALVLTIAMPLLAGCVSSNDTPVTKSAAYSGSPTEIYEAVLADGIITIADALFAEGIPGFVGNKDGTVSEIRVRIDPETNFVHVSANGGAETVYDDIASLSLDEYEGYIVIFNAAGDQVSSYWSGDGPASAQFYDGEEERRTSGGFYGLETATANLPTGTAVYSGYWNAEGSNETMSTNVYHANMTLAVDFDDSSIAGVSNGYFGAYNSETDTSTSGQIIGIVDGVVEGSRISGQMAVSGVATGQMDMMGAFYGESGDYMAGGIAGSLTSEVGTQTLGGGFLLYGDEEGGCCF